MNNMEQFHVISILGANARMLDPSTSLEQAHRRLNRHVMRSHAHHLAAWLLRGGVVLCLFLLGRHVAEGGLGSVLTWTAGLLGIYLAGYACKGHLRIQNDRKAKLYWLHNEAGNEAFSSDDSMIVTMPVQDTGAASAAQRHRA
jgi:hypothetical protein